MNDGLRMNDHIQLLWRNGKQMQGLNQFQPLIHHGGRINGDFAAHIPIGMFEGLFWRHMAQLFF